MYETGGNEREREREKRERRLTLRSRFARGSFKCYSRPRSVTGVSLG